MPCLPGIDLMGSGFDVLKGSTTGLQQAVDFTYNTSPGAKTYVNPFNSSLVYAVPIEASVRDKTHGQSAVESKTFYTSQSYANDLSTSVGLSVSYLAFSASTKVSYAEQHLMDKSRYGSIVTSEMQVTLYEVVLDPPQLLNMSSSLSRYLALLPPEYNASTNATYNEFLDYYGSHFIYSATFGGAGRMTSVVNSEYSKTQNQNSIAAEASLKFKFLISVNAHGEGNKSHSDADTAFTNGSIFSTSMVGGDPTDLTDWSAWEKTFYNAPAQVSYRVAPISNIVMTSDPGRANAINLAVADRLKWGGQCAGEKASLAHINDQVACAVNLSFPTAYQVRKCFGMPNVSGAPFSNPMVEDCSARETPVTSVLGWSQPRWKFCNSDVQCTSAVSGSFCSPLCSQTMPCPRLQDSGVQPICGLFQPSKASDTPMLVSPNDPLLLGGGGYALAVSGPANRCIIPCNMILGDAECPGTMTCRAVPGDMWGYGSGFCAYSS